MLNPTFQRELNQYIKDYLEFMRYWKKGGSTKAKQAIKYENPYDYFYGYAIGQIEGFALGFYQGLYNKHPADEDHREIMEIIEVHYKEMREILSKSMK